MQLETRLECDIPVRCHSQGQAFDARIVDISVRGVRLLLSQPVERRGEVTLTRPGDEDMVTLEVVWARKVTTPACVEAGMVYRTGELPSGSWLEDAYRRLNEGAERKLIRLGVEARGTVQEVGSSNAVPVECIVRNLGVGGCRFESARQWPDSTGLTLSVGPMAPLQALTVAGRIIHCTASPDPRKWLSGLEFDTKLDAAQEALLTAYLMVLSPIQ